MEPFQRLKAGLTQIVNVLPGLLLALVILMAGFLVARMVERLVDAMLGRLHFDREAAKWGVTEAVERTGTREGPTRVAGKLLFWSVMLFVILLSSSALGIENINDVFANLIGYIPTVFAAIIVIVLGLILGEFVRALILASAGGVEGVPTLAKVAKGVVIMISVFMALQQVGVAADIVTTAFTLILGAVALAVALAFGLGNMRLAGEITRRWYDAGRSRCGGHHTSDEVAGDAGADPAPPAPGAAGAAPAESRGEAAD